MTDCKIFANHAHIYPAELREDGTIKHLKNDIMPACGIDKVVCFAPFSERFIDAGIKQDQNDWLFNEMGEDDSLVGFGTIAFERGKCGEQVRHIAELGFKGIKIHPAFQEVNVMGEQLCEVYDAAQELGLFLSFHTGIHWHRIADYNLLLFDEVAYNYPRLKFSMEHIGGYHFFKEALAVMKNNSRGEPKHVFGGWTSIDENENGLPGNWTLSNLELRTVIYQTGEKCSIFGLDYPFNDADDINKAIERIKTLDITDTAKANILGLNLAEVLGVSL